MASDNDAIWPSHKEVHRLMTTLNDLFNYESELSLDCPFCQGNYLHQRAYRIWSSNEDSQSDCYTIIDAHFKDDNLLEYNPDLTIKHTPNEENPSPRSRGSLCIEFYCEDCEKISTFKIFQHKGCTYLGWK